MLAKGGPRFIESALTAHNQVSDFVGFEEGYCTACGSSQNATDLLPLMDCCVYNLAFR